MAVNIDEVKDAVSSILISLKTPLTIKELQKDYFEIEGENLPYRRLGYNSSVELLQNMPGVLKLLSDPNESSKLTLYDGDKSKHLKELIMKQKKKIKLEKLSHQNGIYHSSYVTNAQRRFREHEKLNRQKEKTNELKTQQKIVPQVKMPYQQNMPTISSTAQNRLNKYPKKCHEPLNLSGIENNNQNVCKSSNGCIASIDSVKQCFVLGTPLTVEDYDEKFVLVSANYGSANIWIRLFGSNTDKNFIQMQTKLNFTMKKSGFKISEQLTEGRFYAVLYNSSWHRVQILSVVEDGKATCLLIDTGEKLNISKDQIFNLEPVFMKTKIQAIQCVLTKLDHFKKFYGLKEVLDEILLNKAFFLSLDKLQEGYFPSITLYEKNGESDRVNVNNLIIQRFLEKSIPRLPSFAENTIVNGRVSSVVESGHLYLQLNSDIVSSLEAILPNEKILFPDYFLKSKDEIKKDQIYLSEYKDENGSMWRRIQIVELKDDTKAQIIYIDYGKIDECEITKLANLDLYDPLMAKIAPQAMKVSLHLLPQSVITPSIVNKMIDILGGEKKVLVNVINEPTNDVPIVNIFENVPDIQLSYININIKIYLSYIYNQG